MTSRSFGATMGSVVTAAAVLCGVRAATQAQEGQPSEAKQPKVSRDAVKYFAGTWEGTGQGESGKSRVELRNEWVLGEKFLNMRNKTTYEPNDKNPKGETHEDWGFISFDRGRRCLVLRQFHVEGFVNQYRLDDAASDEKNLVFMSEQIENVPQGFRARETYRIVGDDEFSQTFELAPPGKEFSGYSEARLKRKR